MKKNKLLVMLACLGLLVTGCNGGGSKASTESTKAPTSSKQPSTQTTQSQPTSTSSSSQEEPPADDDYYYSLPFDAAAKDSGDKWKKGYESVWTFKVSKDHAKMDFAFAAKMSSSSHGDRSLYTNHENASQDDKFESNEANDGTCRIELKVNGVAQTVTTKTYSEAGLDNADFAYFRVASFAVTKGEVVVSMKTHASTGYRLIFGDDARLFYPKADGQDPAYVEPPAEEGYTVTFVATHCKVYIYEGQDYSDTPVEATQAITRDEDGKICKYVAPDAEGNGEVKPQVNFKVVCDNGYAVDTTCIVPSGTKGTEWNNVKAADTSGEIYRITVIKADITVTITPVDPSTLKEAFEITFVCENCSTVVYIGKKADNGGVDAGPKFFSRDKNDPTKLQKGNDAQFNFEVIANENFVWNDTTEYSSKGEASASAVAFISGSFNKLKKLEDGSYNITQVNSDLVITLTAVAAA